mmetsp:Transcript_42053/g.101366  ORF Transcript_42053/g.101366 Transcript_42053/m.101366 type:complete len:214 (+) Transcript_42053:990-1631(+)
MRRSSASMSRQEKLVQLLAHLHGQSWSQRHQWVLPRVLIVQELLIRSRHSRTVFDQHIRKLVTSVMHHRPKGLNPARQQGKVQLLQHRPEQDLVPVLLSEMRQLLTQEAVRMQRNQNQHLPWDSRTFKRCLLHHQFLNSKLHIKCLLNLFPVAGAMFARVQSLTWTLIRHPFQMATRKKQPKIHLRLLDLQALEETIQQWLVKQLLISNSALT